MDTHPPDGMPCLGDRYARLAPSSMNPLILFFMSCWAISAYEVSQPFPNYGTKVTWR